MLFCLSNLLSTGFGDPLGSGDEDCCCSCSRDCCWWSFWMFLLPSAYLLSNIVLGFFLYAGLPIDCLSIYTFSVCRPFLFPIKYLSSTRRTYSFPTYQILLSASSPTTNTKNHIGSLIMLSYLLCILAECGLLISDCISIFSFMRVIRCLSL